MKEKCHVPLTCSITDCEIILELDLSFTLGICRWCRRELEPEWDDDDWFNDYMVAEGLE